MTELSGHGIHIDLPQGWDGRIYRREGGHPVLHAASFRLPEGDGDFGPRAVAATPGGGVFVAMPQYDPALAGTPLYADQGVPVPIAAEDLNAKAFPRPIPGLVAVQRFFTENGRPFCVYLVLGASGGDAADPLTRANRVLATIRVEPLGTA